MSLTKADIVERVFKEAGFSKKEAADLIDLVFKVIKDTLSKGEKVKISGFGNFSIRDKSTRNAVTLKPESHGNFSETSSYFQTFPSS